MDEKWMAYWDYVNVELYALVKQLKKENADRQFRIPCYYKSASR